MSEPPSSQQALRERSRDERTMFCAVDANAGSGKTTAISEQRTAWRQPPAGAEAVAEKVAVVGIPRRPLIRSASGRRAGAAACRANANPATTLEPLDHLERAFFGTIHSFCLRLAQRYGQTLGLNLNPAVIDGSRTTSPWDEFLEQDADGATTCAAADDRCLPPPRAARTPSSASLARALGVRPCGRLRGGRLAPAGPSRASAATT